MRCDQIARWIRTRAEAVDAATGGLAKCAELVQAGKQLGLGPQLRDLEQCIAELQAVLGMHTGHAKGLGWICTDLVMPAALLVQHEVDVATCLAGRAQLLCCLHTNYSAMLTQL